jgi:predicted choloylglycine hydrolase
MSEQIDIVAIRDDRAGEALLGVFAPFLPAYTRWMRRAPVCGLDVCLAKLRSHMPEIYPTFERLVALFGGTDEVVRFLSLYKPPRVIRGCSQIVIEDEEGPALIRSYDHHPKLFDGVVLASAWGASPVLAVTDCIWGALDGLNGDGLAVALAFGGRNAVGAGFAAPLLARYILETCATVAEAQAVLQRVPVYMPYTFVIVDASGEFLTVFADPERPARCVRRRASANHQSPDDWPAYCRHTASVERLRTLESLLDRPRPASSVVEAYLRPPLWRSEHRQGFGTLYVVEYRPVTGVMTLHWPGRSEQFDLRAFEAREFQVMLGAPADDSKSIAS